MSMITTSVTVHLYPCSVLDYHGCLSLVCIEHTISCSYSKNKVSLCREVLRAVR